ncbi:putative metal-binding motif-containing protein, partial [Myxococcota bacterium]|nr:putative metal-binding motif-containing protein [Myxococcota bacterium]
MVTCWTDADGDGFGATDGQVLACACGFGLSDNDQDCDDDDPDAWPGASETLYDGVDSDCLGLQGEYDQDGDGHDWIGGKGVDGTDCDDADPLINPEVLDLCDDKIDQDCDGEIQECGLGVTTDAGDAWWQVYRDSDIRTYGYFGRLLRHAG